MNSTDRPVRRLEMEDLDALREVFLNYPYKETQQRFQGIDNGSLADFFVENERLRLESGPAEGGERWVGTERGKLVAIIGLQGDNWHSRFYPLRFARLAPLVVNRAPARLRQELLETVLRAARAEGVQLLSARIDGAEYELLHELQRRGFYLVDCSLKISARLDRVPVLAPPSRAGGMSIREYSRDDLADLRRIAATSHSINHLYNDPNLERNRTNQLFEAWVERCCTGPNSAVFVVERRKRPCGFVIYLIPAALNKALRTHLLVLDFVCLASSARGGGVGRWLISQTLRRLSKSHTMLELRTSQNNYPALACYEALGMRIIGSDFLLHRLCAENAAAKG